jgi:hypothetical protein
MRERTVAPSANVFDPAFLAVRGETHSCNFFLEANHGMHHLEQQVVFSPSIGLFPLDDFFCGNIETATEYLNEYVAVAR